MTRRILIVVQAYPQISETYIKNEIDELCKTCDVEILALTPGNYPYRSRRPHIVLSQDNQQNVLSYLRGFAPHVIHGHYFHLAQQVAQLSALLKSPYTMRTHSFDVLGAQPQTLQAIADIVNRDNCLGVLTFPFMCATLQNTGVKPGKIEACFPIIDYGRFFDPSPNGADIMNVGAAIPKKNMEDYVTLSRIVPDRHFNLYAMGYKIADLQETNTRVGGRIHFIEPVEPEDMPQHYKRHQWLVYTASRKFNTVGWPLAIAEAQASGTGVCMQNIRPDLKEFVGDAGFLFDTPDEAAEIIRRPVPDAMRQRGFELAKRSDVTTSIHQLFRLWDRSAN